MMRIGLPSHSICILGCQNNPKTWLKTNSAVLKSSGRLGRGITCKLNENLSMIAMNNALPCDGGKYVIKSMTMWDQGLRGLLQKEEFPRQQGTCYLLAWAYTAHLWPPLFTLRSWWVWWVPGWAVTGEVWLYHIRCEPTCPWAFSLFPNGQCVGTLTSGRFSIPLSMSQLWAPTKCDSGRIHSSKCSQRET